MDQVKKMQHDSVFKGIFARTLVWYLRVVCGTLVLATNLVLDTAYLFHSTFADSSFYNFYMIVLAIRYLIPIFGIIKNCVNLIDKPLDTKVRDDQS